MSGHRKVMGVVDTAQLQYGVDMSIICYVSGTQYTDAWQSDYSSTISLPTVSQVGHVVEILHEV